MVGLGNPGPQYARTRHNIGAMVAAELVRRSGGKLGRHKRAVADVAETRIASEPAIVMLPMSYMNTSGGPVKALAQFYKVPLERIVVLHDELDIDLGAIRLKFAGGDNGHNGLKSIRSALASGDWFRVRLGIGRPQGNQDPADFVLKPFAANESAEVNLLIERGADAVEALITHGLEVAQNSFNS